MSENILSTDEEWIDTLCFSPNRGVYFEESSEKILGWEKCEKTTQTEIGQSIGTQTETRSFGLRINWCTGNCDRNQNYWFVICQSHGLHTICDFHWSKCKRGPQKNTYYVCTVNGCNRRLSKASRYPCVMDKNPLLKFSS